MRNLTPHYSTPKSVCKQNTVLNTMTGQLYEGIVVGAGPGGLATLAALIDAGVKDILWMDMTFGGGRLNELYREISS